MYCSPICIISFALNAMFFIYVYKNVCMCVRVRYKTWRPMAFSTVETSFWNQLFPWTAPWLHSRILKTNHRPTIGLKHLRISLISKKINCIRNGIRSICCHTFSYDLQCLAQHGFHIVKWDIFWSEQKYVLSSTSSLLLLLLSSSSSLSKTSK